MTRFDPDRIQTLLAAGRAADAVAQVQAAADAGDSGAVMQLAVWRLVGQPLRRDLPTARALLERAATLGHVDAALMQVALTANGSGGPADWPGALALLSRAAASDPVAAEHLELVRRMRLRPDGAPDVPIARQPLPAPFPAFRLPAFLSPAECAHVAQAAGPLLERSLVADPRTGRLVPHPVRTSDAAVLGPTREDLVLRAIALRLSAATGTDPAAGEPLTVLRYAPGQQYRPHMDTLPGETNQRDWTVIIYLNGGYGGGETRFPAIGLTVAPRPGDALAFRNTDDAGRPLAATSHAGLPVTAGVKWVATRWIRRRPLHLWG